jgi:hypothetical protein
VEVNAVSHVTLFAFLMTVKLWSKFEGHCFIFATGFCMKELIALILWSPYSFKKMIFSVLVRL